MEGVLRSILCVEPQLNANLHIINTDSDTWKLAESFTTSIYFPLIINIFYEVPVELFLLLLADNSVPSAP